MSHVQSGENHEAVTVADLLIKEWICSFGVLLELHSDQERNFEYAPLHKVKIHKTRIHSQTEW